MHYAARISKENYKKEVLSVLNKIDETNEIQTKLI